MAGASGGGVTSIAAHLRLCNVDVVDTGPGAGDDAQVGRRRHHPCSERGAGARNDGVIGRNEIAQRGFIQRRASVDVNLSLSLQQLDAVRVNRVEHQHARTRFGR
jgi:hypothetical protein